MTPQFYYVYVLRSARDGAFYTGYSENLRKRFGDHEAGRVPSTKNRLPLELVY